MADTVKIQSATSSINLISELLGEKGNTKINYDNVLATCENIRSNVITDLKNILDDYKDISSKKNLIWQGIAGDKFFVTYNKDLDRYEQYLTQCSLENYVKSVENLVGNNKNVDKGINLDEIAKINENIPMIFGEEVVITAFPKSSDNEVGKNAENKVHASINTATVSGQNDTTKVGANNNISSSTNTTTVSGQNDTTIIGSNNNINSSKDTQTVSGQNDTSSIGINNNVTETINNDAVKGQSNTTDYLKSNKEIFNTFNTNVVKGQTNTASKVEVNNDINNDTNNTVTQSSGNGNISESQQSLMNDIFNLSGGDQ